jgi:hypothetical protein
MFAIMRHTAFHMPLVFVYLKMVFMLCKINHKERHPNGII